MIGFSAGSAGEVVVSHDLWCGSPDEGEYLGIVEITTVGGMTSIFSPFLTKRVIDILRNSS